MVVGLCFLCFLTPFFSSDQCKIKIRNNKIKLDKIIIILLLGWLLIAPLLANRGTIAGWEAFVMR